MIIGRAHVELRGITDRLERDIERALGPKIKDLANQIQDDISEGVKRGFSDIDSSDIDIDVSGVGERLGREIREDLLFALNRDLDLDIGFDADRIEREVSVIKQYIQEELGSTSGIRMKVEGFEDADFEIEPEIDNSAMARVKYRMDDLKSEYEEMEAEIVPSYDFTASLVAQAELAFLARPRFVDVIPRINRNAWLDVINSMKGLSGLRVVSGNLEAIGRMVANLDRSIPMITVMGSAITLLTGAVTVLVGDLSSLGLELMELVGLLIPMPGILAGVVISFGALFAVLMDLPKVLPDVVQQFGRLQREMSGAFWERAARPIRNFIDVLLPEFGAGIVNTSRNLGIALGGVSTSLATLLSGQMTGMFRNLNDAILRSYNYTDDFAEALVILGRHGSEYLPRLADWAGRLTIRFRNWLDEAERSGDLQRWTDGAIDNLRQLGGIVWNTGRIFVRFGEIAREAGGATLESFNQALRSIGDVVGSEPFRSQMIKAFESAHYMFQQISNHSGPALTRFFDQLADTASHTFIVMGDTLSQFIRGLADALASPAFSSGFEDMISGMGRGVQGFTPHLDAIAAGFGSIARIIGEMSERYLPLLGSVLGSLGRVVVQLEGPIISLIDAFSDILEAVTLLPDQVVAAGIAFLYFRGPIVAVIGVLNTLRKAMMLSVATSAATSAFGVMSAAVTGLSTGLASMLPSLGRFAAIAWPVAAVTATALAAGHLVDNLQRGAVVPTVESITDAITEMADSKGGIEALDEAFSNFGTLAGMDVVEGVDSVTDAFDRLLNQSTTDKFAGWLDGFLPVEGYMEKIEGRVATLDTALANMLRNGEKEAVDAFVASLEDQGYSLEEINQLLPETQQAYDEVGNSAIDAADAARAEAEAQREAEVAHRQLSGAIDTQVSSLSELIGLQRKAAGEILSTREAQRGLEDSFDAATQAIENNGKTLDITTEKGRANQSALDNIASSAYDLAEAMYASDESTEAIAERMGAARDAFIETARNMGMTRDEAVELANELGLIPEKIVTDIEADTTTARYNLQGFLVEVDKASGSVTIDGDPAEANMTLGELLGDVNTADGTVTIGSNTYPAEMTIAEFHAWVQQGEQAMVGVGADTTVATDAITNLPGEIEGGWHPPMLPVDADTDPAIHSLAIFRDGAPSSAGWQAPQLPFGADTNPIINALSTVREPANNGWHPPLLPFDAEVGTVVDTVNILKTPENFGWHPPMLAFNAYTQPVTDSVNLLMRQTSDPANAATMHVGADPTQAQVSTEGARADIASKPAMMYVNVDSLGIAGQLENLRGYVSSLRANLSVGANTADANAAISGVIISAVTASPVVRVNANVVQALSMLRMLLAQVNRSIGRIQIHAVPLRAMAELRRFIAMVNRAYGTVQIRARSLTANAILSAFLFRVNRSSGTVRINANTANARAAVNSFVANTNARVATVTVRTRRVDAFAQGGIVAAYANGGVRRSERHVAQIARAGAMRVWAEPETGGEAYIPLALSKRSRSLKILAEVARLMGKQVLPANVKNIHNFAAGGILTRRDMGILSRRPARSATMDARTPTATVVSPAREKVEVHNHFTINNNGELDVNTLSREVSRQIMFGLDKG